MSFVQPAQMPVEMRNEDLVRRFLEAQGHRCDMRISMDKVTGGLESLGVWIIEASHRSASGGIQNHKFVIKRAPLQSPEIWIHREVLSTRGADFAPRLLASEKSETEQVLLLEYIPPVSLWPWTQPANSCLVLDSLARFHETAFQPIANDTGYENLLRQKGMRLLQLLEEISGRSPLAPFRSSARAIGRLLERLPKMRQQLMNSAFGKTLIHGDVHSGNVVLRREEYRLKPVFIDWGRSRMGSPLEDVSSWLQSLRYWDAEGRRKHDTLLRHYLVSRGMHDQLTEEVRAPYWCAAACNVLAGAAVYHFSMANDPNQRTFSTGEEARLALGDCLRVLRRADSYWR